jgi:hypothetical protein
MIQLILHLWGDYLTQSDWMAQNKTKHWWPAICHATVYSLPFLLIGSWKAALVIWSTHAVIDRYRLARYLCWAKNFLAPMHSVEVVRVEQGTSAKVHKLASPWWHPWALCKGTGYHGATEPFLAVWLMILADNTLHLTINYLALAYL